MSRFDVGERVICMVHDLSEEFGPHAGDEGTVIKACSYCPYVDWDVHRPGMFRAAKVDFDQVKTGYFENVWATRHNQLEAA